MKTLLRACALLLVCCSFAFARVNVNVATQAQLETLPDVGPVKAKAILDYRKKNGPFKALEDLEKVRGIGPVTVKALRNEVSFANAPAKAPEKPKPLQSLDVKKVAPTKPVAAPAVGTKTPAQPSVKIKRP